MTDCKMLAPEWTPSLDKFVTPAMSMTNSWIDGRKPSILLNVIFKVVSNGSKLVHALNISFKKYL